MDAAVKEALGRLEKRMVQMTVELRIKRLVYEATVSQGLSKAVQGFALADLQAATQRAMRLEHEVTAAREDISGRTCP